MTKKTMSLSPPFLLFLLPWLFPISHLMVQFPLLESGVYSRTSLLDELETLIKSDIVSFLEAGADGAHTAAQDSIKDKVKVHYQDRLESREIEENQLMEAIDILLRRHFRTHTLANHRY